MLKKVIHPKLVVPVVVMDRFVCSRGFSRYSKPVPNVVVPALRLAIPVILATALVASKSINHCKLKYLLVLITAIVSA